ncbi:MAG: hypothetical protein ACI4R9_08180 [Kiritimatiellia bacterium]
MKRTSLSVIVCALGLWAGAAPEQDANDPVTFRLEDPNPFANYEPAMRSSAEFPLAVNWQAAHRAEVAEATKPATLAGFLASDAAAGELLAKVKEAYTTDPLVMTQIGAISQMVMCPKCPKAPHNRAKWTAALLAAAKGAPDAYRRMFFLDQLRWCGHADEADAVRAIGKAAGDQAVAEFAEMVATEIAR